MSTHKSREVPAGEFKAHCLKLMDEVNETGTEIVITKRGKPVARLVPATSGRPSIYGCMKGTFEIVGDIESPIEEDWDALKGYVAVFEGGETYPSTTKPKKKAKR
ncbi:MAG: type II toxin-antitoxin system Phd/YefM family antitoxin [Rhodospirillales bacterium]